jgi:transposase
MAFREVTVIQVKEALRRWLQGEGERPIARAAGISRGTARRYITAAQTLGVDRTGGEAQLTDALIGQVCELVRPSRPDGHGESWHALVAHEDDIKGWVKKGFTAAKIGILLRRRGVDVPERTVSRFCLERCGAGRRARTTVRVDDPPAGTECQVDFGRLGLVPDGTGKMRVCQALVFTACWSRHMFVWLSFSQSIEAVIEGFEQAWEYFGGVFPVVIPDSMKAIVDGADNVAPRLNDTFMEYAQSRGFAVDPARIRTPTDKPRVERVIHYVQHNFFAGETFMDLADARRRARAWCTETAGQRIHGTTCCRPLEAFGTGEQALLLPVPVVPFDIPVWTTPKVHRDFHVEVARALYSAPHHLLGHRVRARRDAVSVKLFFRGELVRVHPKKPPGQRSTNLDDLPKGTEVYATRDLETLKAMAAKEGPAVGAYAASLLDTPLPWTKMRQVYRLLGLVKKWGATRVDQACATALEAEAVNVSLVSRMLERAKEAAGPVDVAPPNVVQGRFARDAGEFKVVGR